MLRLRTVSLALVAAFAFAGDAGARAFLVTKAGNAPAVAVDAAGTAHVAWDTVAGDNTSTTHYCKVPRTAATCAKGTEKTFAPAITDQDFSGPRVYVPGGGKRVIIVTSRCCTAANGPDGNAYDTHVFSFVSTDAGAHFDGGTSFGTFAPEVGAALSAKGTFFSLGFPEKGTGLQVGGIAAFTGARTQFTPIVAQSGGVGTSSTATLVALNDKTTVYAGRVVGTTVKLVRVAPGNDTQVASGFKAPDLLYRTPGKRPRYVLRRYAGGKLGPPVAVTLTGDPIFAGLFQDSFGRSHVVWQDAKGLNYRRSDETGRHFGAPALLSTRSGYFDTAVAANAKGRAAVVYDSNTYAGRVGGFTAG
jgi:hypothetical protein